MRESLTEVRLDTEAALSSLAARAARAWCAARRQPLIIGLRGELGAGKTTWVRALLRGLEYEGRVPSPTYTLLEHYETGSLVVVHLDLYRLASDEDLDHIGLRDWLGREGVWILAEWPERAVMFAAHCDLLLEFAVAGVSARTVRWRAQTSQGALALGDVDKLLSSYPA